VKRINTYINNIRRTSVLILTGVIVLNSGCKNSKSAVQSGANPYQRPPLVETTDEQVRTDALMIDAKSQQELGNDTRATAIYRQILTRDANYSAAYYELSQIYAQRGEVDSALIFAQKAVSLNGDNVWYLLQEALMYRYTEQQDNYIKTWERIVEQNPEVLDYYYELSNAYLKAGNSSKAIATLNRVEQRVGITETVSLQKAKLWNEQGKTDKAIKEIEALSEAMPSETKYSAMLAETHMQNGDYDQAKKYYDRILETNPNDEYIHLSLAEYYRVTQKPRQAYEELRQSFLQDALTTENKLQILGQFYTTDEFYGIYSSYAFDLLDVVMSQSDDSISYAAFYGNVLMHQKKYGAAARQFELALLKDSSQYDLWEVLLVCLTESDAPNAHIAQYAKRAQQLFPVHPLPYFILGVTAYENGRYQEALEQAQRCEQTGIDNSYLERDVYTLITQCYRELKDERIYVYYEKLAALYPDDKNILNSYAYQLALDKRDLEKAAEMSRRTLKEEPDNPYFLDTYAWILHQMGRDSEARSYIQRAMERDGTPSEEALEHYEAITGQPYNK